MARHRIGNGERRDHSHHEGRGGGENPEAGIGEEEQNKWPEIEHELEERIELRFCRGFHIGPIFSVRLLCER